MEKLTFSNYTGEFAPILITVYDRLDHLKECINSLLKCSNVSNTELFVASDFAYRSEDIPKIEAVRAFVQSIIGFKSVHLIARDSNVGSFNNFFDSINQIFKNYNTLILLEDDNIVVPSFIDYMNLSLSIHQNDNEIFSISGYMYPIKFDKIKLTVSTFKWRGFSAWGVGLWKTKWEVINWEDAYIKKAFRSPLTIVNTMKVANHVLPILFYSLRKGRKIGDAIITINLVEKKMHSVFPIISLVRNIGNDGLGESKKNTNLFLQQEIDVNAKIKPLINVKCDLNINKLLYKYFEKGHLDKLKFYGRLILTNLQQATKA